MVTVAAAMLIVFLECVQWKQDLLVGSIELPSILTQGPRSWLVLVRI